MRKETEVTGGFAVSICNKSFDGGTYNPYAFQAQSAIGRISIFCKTALQE